MSRADREKAAIDKASSLTVNAMGTTAYENTKIPKPVVYESTIQGKQIQYYSTEQGNQNMMLKASVAENEEQITTYFELQQEHAVNARVLLQERNKTRMERLKEYDDGYRWPETSSFTSDIMISDYELDVSMNRISSVTPDEEPPSVLPIPNTLQQLLQKPLSAVQRTAVEDSLDPVLKGHLHDHNQCTVHPLVTIILQLHELVHTDVLQFIKKELTKSGDKIGILMDQVNQTEQEQSEAIASEDIDKADKSHVATIALLEKLISQIRGRLSQIMMGSGDTNTYRGQYEQKEQEGTSTIRKLKSDNELLRTDIVSDLQTLVLKGEQASEEAAVKTKLYEDFQKTSRQELSQNSRRQDEIWEDIERLLSEMRMLAEDRQNYLTHHLQVTEAEEKRKREYAEYSEVYAEHTRRLEDLLMSTETSLKLVGSVSDYFHKGCEVVASKNVESELQDIRMSELKRYLEVFRRYAIKGNDLLLKRKTRLQGIRRQIRNCEAQVALCSESLDPNRGRYKDELIRLSQEESSIDKIVSDMSERFAQQELEFTPTEDLLEELEIDFVPPRIENKEIESDHRKRLLKMNKQFVGKEQEEVDKEVTDLRKLHTDTSLGKEVISKKRQSRRRPQSAASQQQQQNAAGQ